MKPEEVLEHYAKQAWLLFYPEIDLAEIEVAGRDGLKLIKVKDNNEDNAPVVPTIQIVHPLFRYRVFVSWFGTMRARQTDVINQYHDRIMRLASIAYVLEASRWLPPASPGMQILPFNHVINTSRPLIEQRMQVVGMPTSTRDRQSRSVKLKESADGPE